MKKTQNGPANTDDARDGLTVRYSPPESVDEVIAQFLERTEAGECVDPASLLERYPQYRDELSDFFANHVWAAGGPPASDEPIEQDLTGQKIGNYRLLCRVARGGMGVVYRGRDETLGRNAAVKLIASGHLADRESIARFRTEAEAAGRLQHPGILPIFAVGQWEGHAYYAMPWIDGPSLETLVHEKIDPAEAARLVRDLARAVAHAHEHGILHRDIKPANVLLDAERRPLLIDFGLAKLASSSTVQTRTGQVLGTPNYMSPEQASGHGVTGPQTDVYGLGAVLYALLSGHPPHEGDSPVAVLHSVLTDDPPPLSSSSTHVIPRDLRAICMRSLATDPCERYASAAALASDLDQFLAGEPVSGIGSDVASWILRPLRRDHHARHFRSWGNVLLLLGAIIWTAHLAIYLLQQAGWSSTAAYTVPRTIMFLAIGTVIALSRRGAVLPRSIAERPIWSIWTGYLIALLTVNLILRLSQSQDLSIFAFGSALAGFGFVAMAGHIWGACYLIGGGFLILAPLLTQVGSFDSLCFGTAWLTALALLAWRYR